MSNLYDICFLRKQMFRKISKLHIYCGWLAWFMVFNATFNNISVISWRLILLVKEIGENPRSVVSHWQTLSYNVVSSTRRLKRIRTYNISGDSTYCTAIYSTFFYDQRTSCLFLMWILSDIHPIFGFSFNSLHFF